MSQLTRPEANLFDDKLTNQHGFSFNGQTRGATWKTKLRNYFISKCLAARTRLTWAEEFEGELILHKLWMEIAAKPGSTMPPMLMDSLNNQTLRCNSPRFTYS